VRLLADRCQRLTRSAQCVDVSQLLKWTVAKPIFEPFPRFEDLPMKRAVPYPRFALREPCLPQAGFSLSAFFRAHEGRRYSLVCDLSRRPADLRQRGVLT